MSFRLSSIFTLPRAHSQQRARGVFTPFESILPCHWALYYLYPGPSCLPSSPCGYCDKASYRSPCRKNVPASPLYEFLVAQQFRSPALCFENRLALGEVFSDDAGCLQPDGGVVGIRSGREHLDGSRQQRDRIWVPGVIPITEPVSCVFSILPVKSSNRTRKANIILLS